MVAPNRRRAGRVVIASDTGPLAPVWRRLRRMPIEDRNEFPTVDLYDDRIMISCNAAEHTGRVIDGDLALDDHDVDAELALLALGAQLPPCLVYLAVWREAVMDPAFLLAWGDDVDDESLRATREDWEGNYWESWPLEPPAARVLFGPELQRLLALSAARRAAGDADEARFDGWYALQRATQTRARSAFVRSLAAVDAHPRPDALVPVRIHIGTERAGGDVRGRLARLDSGVHLVLPFDWLWTVWARNGGLAAGRFVVAVQGADDVVVTWRRSGGPLGEHVPEVVLLPER